MKNSISRYTFIYLLSFNLTICLILNVIAVNFPFDALTLIVPALFFGLILWLQPLPSGQHTLFTAILMIFIPILSPMNTSQITLVYSLFYMLSTLSFDLALRAQKPLPYPDFLAPIFILFLIMINISIDVIFSIAAAYYLARITVLILMNVKNLQA